MAKLSLDRKTGTRHPREGILSSGTLGALNAEVVIDCDGSGCVSLDMRGTFSMTVEVSGTVDGTNYVVIPMRSQLGGAWLAAVVGTTAGVWMGTCIGFDKVRARVTAYTSGSSTATLLASSGLLDDFAAKGGMTTAIATAVGASGAAVTLTIASPGAGLRHYLTYLSINRFAAALLTAAAAPVTVTTTNIPTGLAFSFGAEALPQGSLDRWREDFAYPMMATAQGTATTIVCPATTNVIWRVTAGYFVAP